MAESLSTNSTFYLSLATMAFAFLSASLAYTIKSKCSSVKCCYGALEIIRDIEAEVEIELEEQQLPQQHVNTPIESLGNTRRNSQRNSHLIKEAVKELNKTYSETQEIDFTKSMTNKN